LIPHRIVEEMTMGTERVIKRYTNRKLYDTDQSRYVTLDDIAKLVRGNEEVRVIDNETQDDLTAVTFAQIILEEEKKKTNLVSVPFLRKLIHSGEAAVQDFSDSAKRAFDQIGDLTGRAGGRVREVVEEGGKAVEGVVGEGKSFIDDLFNLPQRRLESLRDVAREQVDRLRQSPALQREIERLEKSMHSIEQMLSQLRTNEERAAENGNGHGTGSASENVTASGADEDAPGEVLDPAVAPEIDDDLHEHETRATGGGRSRG
jgi:polyhydroxyalkanoate synthesis repressor PhaR